jgi:lipopolysaccharide transport system permease protein
VSRLLENPPPPSKALSVAVENVPDRPSTLGSRIAYLRDITAHLVTREITERHRDSLLGWVWSLTPPLLQLAATFFVFTRVIPLGVENYALFLFIGILAWNWFSRSLGLATAALEGKRSLVLRPGFPIVVLPVVSVLVAFVDYLFAVPILLVALALTTGLRWELVLLPLILLVQLLLTTGISWIVAPLQVYFRDVRHIVGIAVAVGFWLTPIFYRPNQIPEEFSFLYELNPLSYLIEAQRGLLLGEEMPSSLALCLVGVFSFCLLAGGLVVFRTLRQSVPERL